MADSGQADHRILGATEYSAHAVSGAGPGESAGAADPSRVLVRPDAERMIHRVTPWLLAGVMTVAYAAVSVRRHAHLKTTSFDLGIFEQAVRSYAHLQWPTSSLKGPGFPLLGDHFHPILAILAPLYRIAPTPITLLLAQAFLIGLSIVPITTLAMRVVGFWGGVLIGMSYSFSWGLQNAIGFDFHEVSFAVPILAYSMVRLVERRLRSAILIAAPLVLVKEDLPLTLAAIGFCVFLSGNRRWGSATMAAGVILSAVIMTIVIPAINQSGHNPYLTGGVTPGLEAFTRLFTPVGTKAGTLFAILVLSAGLALRSPLILIALPTIAWRFWSDNKMYWGTDFHYSTVLMPIVFIAFIDALERFRPISCQRRRLLAAIAIAISLAASATLGARLPLTDLARPATWRISQELVLQKRLLVRIPNGASVAAPNRIGPQLTSRTNVFLYPLYPNAQVHPDWVLANDPPENWPYTPEAEGVRLAYLRTSGQYRLAGSQGDLYLFQRIK